VHQIVDELASTIAQAATNRTPLCIRGGGSKDFYGGPIRGESLGVGAYRGIVDYEPSELVITARGGTPLAEIEQALHERGQLLAFEPPHYADSVAATTGRATIGGCISAGLSGPRRPYAGAARDAVLGIRLLDGKANDLRFGGQVMKNVAGFDVCGGLRRR
jgi:glycolate oxidase FAD binding subunit